MHSPVSTASADQLIDELKRELKEAHRRETATAEILRIISGSPTNMRAVLDMVAASAARLCDAHDATIHQVDAGLLRLVAHHGPILTGPTMPMVRGALIGRAILERRGIQVADLPAEGTEYPEGSDAARRLGFRTTLAVPLIHADEAIGVIAIRRTEVRPFTDRQLELLKTFADQAVIAIENARLFEEVQARTRELTEALDYQTATNEVLGVISHSPSDVQPVFDTIVRNSVTLCKGLFSALFQFDGELIHQVAHHNFSPAALKAQFKVYPAPPSRGLGAARAILDCAVVHIPDNELDLEFKHQSVARAIGWRSGIFVPMLKEDAPIGVIMVARTEPGAFADSEIELLKTFADQAVIAIENTRLFEEVQARTTELTEALEQQTATSEVLSVISSSQGELEPVFHAMLENAVRICDAKFGNLWLCEGDSFRLVTAHNAPAAWAERWQREAVIRPGPGTGLGRVASTRQLVHIVDVTQEPAYLERDPLFVAQVELAGGRTLLVVPMLKDDELIGIIGIYRQEVRPFSDRQIELLKSFASQAVIAIENTRLLNELRESLQQQTATADVLKVISRSAFDLQAVLDALVESAAKLCGGDDVSILRLEHDVLSRVAHCGSIRAPIGYAIPAVHDTVAGRSVLERRPIHVADLQTETEDYPKGSAIARELGHRTILVVPLLREGTPLGAISLRRNKVEPFSDKQIELVTTFADQAVIAIENTRLFEEVQARTRALTETVEQQTATSEILSVISSSPTQVQPVFDTIARSAVRLCAAAYAMVFRFDGTRMHLSAHYNVGPEGLQVLNRQWPMELDPRSVPARAVLERRVIHVHDVLTEADNPYLATSRPLGIRTMLIVPMMKEGHPIGAVAVYRQAVIPFSDKAIELVETFADQAVIAIENARLFEEVQARTEELTAALEEKTATADVLRVISNSPIELKAVFDTIIASAVRLCGATFGGLHLIEDGCITLDAQYGMPVDEEKALRQDVFPLPISRGTATGRAVLDQAVVHIADIREDPTYRTPLVQRMARYRTLLAVPVTSKGTSIGALALWRTEVRPFSQREISIVSSFADQAVIAIENTRLFEEVQARNRDLTALGEVGRAVSSTLDLKVVLKTIVDRAVELSGTEGGSIFYYRDGRFELGETVGLDEEAIARFRKLDISAGQTGLGEAIAQREPLRVSDILKRPSNPLRDTAIEVGLRAGLIVPLLSGEEPLGALVLQRRRRASSLTAVVNLMQKLSQTNRRSRSRTPTCSRRSRRRAASWRSPASTSRSSSPT